MGVHLAVALDCRARTLNRCNLLILKWRREWDSDSRIPRAINKLGDLYCRGRRDCQECRGALPGIARGTTTVSLILWMIVRRSKPRLLSETMMPERVTRGLPPLAGRDPAGAYGLHACRRFMIHRSSDTADRPSRDVVRRTFSGPS